MFLVNRAVSLFGQTHAVLPKLLSGVLDPLLSDESVEYYLLRLAGFCDNDRHRELLLRANYEGKDAVSQMTELLMHSESPAVKAGLLKVFMCFVNGSPRFLSELGVSKKVVAVTLFELEKIKANWVPTLSRVIGTSVQELSEVAVPKERMPPAAPYKPVNPMLGHRNPGVEWQKPEDEFKTARTSDGLLCSEVEILLQCVVLLRHLAKSDAVQDELAARHTSVLALHLLVIPCFVELPELVHLNAAALLASLCSTVTQVTRLVAAPGTVVQVADLLQHAPAIFGAPVYQLMCTIVSLITAVPSCHGTIEKHIARQCWRHLSESTCIGSGDQALVQALLGHSSSPGGFEALLEARALCGVSIWNILDRIGRAQKIGILRILTVAALSRLDSKAAEKIVSEAVPRVLGLLESDDEPVLAQICAMLLYLNISIEEAHLLLPPLCTILQRPPRQAILGARLVELIRRQLLCHPPHHLRLEAATGLLKVLFGLGHQPSLAALADAVLVLTQERLDSVGDEASIFVEAGILTCAEKWLENWLPSSVKHEEVVGLSALKHRSAKLRLLCVIVVRGCSKSPTIREAVNEATELSPVLFRVLRLLSVLATAAEQQHMPRIHTELQIQREHCLEMLCTMTSDRGSPHYKFVCDHQARIEPVTQLLCNAAHTIPSFLALGWSGNLLTKVAEDSPVPAAPSVVQTVVCATSHVLNSIPHTEIVIAHQWSGAALRLSQGMWDCCSLSTQMELGIAASAWLEQGLDGMPESESDAKSDVVRHSCASILEVVSVSPQGTMQLIDPEHPLLRGLLQLLWEGSNPDTLEITGSVLLLMVRSSPEAQMALLRHKTPQGMKLPITTISACSRALERSDDETEGPLQWTMLQILLLLCDAGGSIPMIIASHVRLWLYSHLPAIHVGPGRFLPCEPSRVVEQLIIKLCPVEIIDIVKSRQSIIGQSQIRLLHEEVTAAPSRKKYLEQAPSFRSLSQMSVSTASRESSGSRVSSKLSSRRQELDLDEEFAALMMSGKL